ncbi:MAG: hypothetical protein RJA59_458 [Pseudomonadota bacterium]|jgi:periplasmic copper chaperone A
MQTRHSTRLAAILAATAAAFTSLPAHAHVGVVNVQTPHAVAAKSYELVLTIPHGCEATVNGAVAKFDTYKVEVTIPTKPDGTALFTGVRPLMDGLFGKVEVVSRDSAGNATKLRWTKTSAAFDSAADDHTYRIALRGTSPNAPFTAIQFPTTQYCKNGAGPDLSLSWTGADAPTVKLYPARVPGWNKYNLSADNEKHTQADVQALLSGYFADAQIVWVGKGAYSANPVTVDKIKALAAKDATYFELANQSSVMLHSTDDIWVRY